jgi:hypothetical protein
LSAPTLSSRTSAANWSFSKFHSLVFGSPDIYFSTWSQSIGAVTRVWVRVTSIPRAGAVPSTGCGTLEFMKFGHYFTRGFCLAFTQDNRFARKPFDCSYRAHCEVNRGADVWVMLGGGSGSRMHNLPASADHCSAEHRHVATCPRGGTASY